MNRDKQRIAIAEVCGIKWKLEPIYVDDEEGPHWYRIEYPNGTEQCGYSLASALPDYPTDLNAMHEAEGVLTPAQHEMFCAVLFSLTAATDETPYPNLDWRTIRKYSMTTAAQRAEAFLRTIGKWEESTKETTK